MTYTQEDVALLQGIQYLESALKLALISENLPLLIASAFSLYSKQETSEALIDSWIVVEQIIDYLWSEYLDLIEISERKDRLECFASDEIGQMGIQNKLLSQAHTSVV